MKKTLLFIGAAAILALTGCKGGKKTDYVVGIAQFAPHVALDAATKGFKDNSFKSGEQHVPVLCIGDVHLHNCLFV